MTRHGRELRTSRSGERGGEYAGFAAALVPDRDVVKAELAILDQGVGRVLARLGEQVVPRPDRRVQLTDVDDEDGAWSPAAWRPFPAFACVRGPAGHADSVVAGRLQFQVSTRFEFGASVYDEPPVQVCAWVTLEVGGAVIVGPSAVVMVEPRGRLLQERCRIDPRHPRAVVIDVQAEGARLFAVPTLRRLVLRTRRRLDVQPLQHVKRDLAYGWPDVRDLAGDRDFDRACSCVEPKPAATSRVPSSLRSSAVACES
jgi:hypothetical protein